MASGGDGPDPGLDVRAAARRIAPLVLRTPLLHVPALSGEAGRPVHLKLESLQRTGSFKIRGAANRILALTDAERARGMVTCSSGNHGRAVAHVAGRLGVPATIFVPEWVDPEKLRGIREAGARAEVGGGTYDEAAARAERFREREGAVFVHPFDDLRVVEGQGTAGLEIVEQLAEGAGGTAPRSGVVAEEAPPTVVVPLSGGGLVAGVAHAVKESRPEARIVAVSARRARVMWESLRAGRPVEWAPPGGAPEGSEGPGGWSEEETLAGALAGGIGLDNRCTFRMVRDLVDEHVLVEEEAIAAAMARAFRSLHLVVEGGGAVGLAALLAGALDGVGEGPLVILLSGGNVEPRRLLDVLGRSRGGEGP